MEDSSFQSFGEVRVLVQDLFRVNPFLYWIDLTLTMSVAWGSAWVAFRTPTIGLKVFWLVISSFAAFRGLIFMHEIVHVPQKNLVGFRWVWNAVCGMAFFMPDYFYIPHYSHHRIDTFSTKDDPEYVAVASQRPRELFFGPVLSIPFLPVLFVVRGLLLGPISLLVRGRLREWVLRHASTMKMNAQYEWKNISAEDRRRSVWQDLGVAVWWGVFLFFAFHIKGWSILLHWYAIIFGMLWINHIRSLARHRYTNVSGNRVSYEEQLLDSITIPEFSPLAIIFMPLGLRYHSLHHMFPTMPYHSHKEAHRRLAATLPQQHLYFKTLAPTLSVALMNFVKSVRANQAA